MRLLNLNLLSLIVKHAITYPTPLNLNYFWGFGSLSGFLLIWQILSGIFLAVHYSPEVLLAFNSIEHIMRDVNGGWIIRYCHSGGASMFFIIIYIHIARALYFRSYRKILLWNSGIIIFLILMATAFLGYVLPWGQMCGYSNYNMVGKKKYSEIKLGSWIKLNIQRLKHQKFSSLNELIRNNLNDVSILRLKRFWPLGRVIQKSSISFGTKLFFYRYAPRKSITLFTKTRDNSNSYAMLTYRYPRTLSSNLLKCRRISVRNFCSEVELIKTTPDLNKTGVITKTKLLDNNVKKKAKNSITSGDLNKEIMVYYSTSDIISKLSTFKIDKCGKYINLTKEFLCDPEFLKFAYYLIKNNSNRSAKLIDDETLYGINIEWFSKAALLIKNSQYKFKPARQIKIDRVNSTFKRIMSITSSRDKIIQKAVSILLELIYEKNGIFLEVSHGFRLEKSCHTALRQIKYGWSAIPWYIEADIDRTFDDINRNVLINILKKKISDKRLLDLISQMYKVNILCPEGFWIKKNKSILQESILSPILCNIYLHELDVYVMNDIVNRYKKGKIPQINPEYTKKIGLTHLEKRLPLHLQDKIKRSKRRHVIKLGLKRIIENEQYIRIKYVRYANDFIIGVRGSKEFAKKIEILVNSFLKSNLHLQLNMDKTKLINTYNDKVHFLDMLIFNKYARDLPYRNSRELENTKRVKNRNKIIRLAKTNKIKKKTRERFIKLLDIQISKSHKKQENFIKEIFSPLNNEAYRSKLRSIVTLLNSVELEDTINIKNDSISSIEEMKPKRVPINKLEIMNRIHKILLKYNAVTTNYAHGKRVWPNTIKEFLIGRDLTYCPENIELDEILIKTLVLSDGQNKKKNSSIQNWLVVIKYLYAQQEKLIGKDKVTLMESKQSLARIQVLKEGVHQAIRPIIRMDRNKIYTKLMSASIMNSKKNPCSKANITSVSDYNIIQYFNSVAHGLLSYYRCADDFYKMKSIVNWFVRYSAISTLKHKHKMASRKVVIQKYGEDLKVSNHKGYKTSLIDRQYVMGLKQDYLMKPDTSWTEKLTRVWITFSKQENFLSKCSVKNCFTPFDNIEIHHIKKLYRKIDENGQVIIKNRSKKLKGWRAIEAGLKRKQIPLCRKHHKELHQDNINIEDLIL